jgi:hypothetical protein
VMHASIDGMGFSAPPEVRAVAIAHKDFVLHNPMRAGTKLPPAGEERFIPGPLSPAEGLTKLEEAAARLAAATPTAEHAYLGPLTPEEWILVQCRHAELHLGFMHFDG